MNNIPVCLDWEVPKVRNGEIECRPSWEDEEYLHDPACLWVNGGDEICTLQI